MEKIKQSRNMVCVWIAFFKDIPTGLPGIHLGYANRVQWPTR